MNQLIILLVSICFLSCHPKESNPNKNKKEAILSITQKDGMTIQTRFACPRHYQRTQMGEDEFGSYLRKLPLKREGAKVKYFDGSIKQNRNVYDAVIDLPIGKKNLHQCADAVMRLQADYLRSIQKEDEIHFNFTNGFRVDYKKWKAGQRVKVEGNKTSWYQGSQSINNSDATFWSYLEMIWTYAGTLSLTKELKKVKLEDLNIGDVFIKGGSPGHAVIVIDLAENQKGEKMFMLAQSYMPAQELQVLSNPSNKSISPWYHLNFGEELKTPEWTFNKNNLKRF